MAINKKRSRNITVEGHNFQWRATGSDLGITVIIWPVCNDNSLVIGSIDYHHDWKEIAKGHYTSQSQLIVTNRIIRELILHVGINEILNNNGQMNIGKIEDFYDVSKAIRR